jgi:hypothetical protein
MEFGGSRTNQKAEVDLSVMSLTARPQAETPPQNRSGEWNAMGASGGMGEMYRARASNRTGFGSRYFRETKADIIVI